MALTLQYGQRCPAGGAGRRAQRLYVGGGVDEPSLHDHPCATVRVPYTVIIMFIIVYFSKCFSCVYEELPNDTRSSPDTQSEIELLARLGEATEAVSDHLLKLIQGLENGTSSPWAGCNVAGSEAMLRVAHADIVAAIGKASMLVGELTIATYKAVVCPSWVLCFWLVKEGEPEDIDDDDDFEEDEVSSHNK